MARTIEQAESIAREHLGTEMGRDEEDRPQAIDLSAGLDAANCVYGGRDATHGTGVTVGWWTVEPDEATNPDTWEPDGWVTVFEDGTIERR